MHTGNKGLLIARRLFAVGDDPVSASRKTAASSSSGFLSSYICLPVLGPRGLLAPYVENYKQCRARVRKIHMDPLSRLALSTKGELLSGGPSFTARALSRAQRRPN